MFFILSKTLDFLIHPAIWIFILIAIAVFIKNVILKRKIIITSFVLFLFFTNSFITDEVMRWWEYPITKENKLDSNYDIGLLLGGGMVTFEAETNRLIFRNNTDRLFQTISLYKTNKIKTIFISSGSGSITFRNMLEANLIKKYMIEIGIPDSVIMVDSTSDNTHENALFTARILKNHTENQRILLITSATHMRRALGCFNLVGLHVTPYVTDKYVGKRRYQIDYLFVPNVECFVKWSKLMHEMLGYFVYKLMGYL